jgi:hypothetical protein
MAVSRYGPRGPFATKTIHVFGRRHNVQACLCDRCERARRTMAEAKRWLVTMQRTIHAAKNQLRAHARKSRAKSALTPEQRMWALIRASRRADPPCEHCGKPAAFGRHLSSCGVVHGADGRPDRAAHGRRVAAGKRWTKLARARAAAEAVAPPAAGRAPASGVIEGTGHVPEEDPCGAT